MKNVTGVFRSTEAADRAVEGLVDAGFAPERISVVMSQEMRDELVSSAPESEEDEGTAAGAGLGSVMGGAAGAAAAGPLGVAVVGPFLGFVGGATAGGAAGALVGGFAGAGIPADRARRYAAEVDRGAIVVAVEAAGDGEAEAAEEIFIQVSGPAAADTVHVTEAAPASR